MNYINPSGISLIREKVELEWASDSILFHTDTDSHKNHLDSSTTKFENKTIEKTSEVQNNDKIPETKKKFDNQQEQKNPEYKSQEEVAAFTEPKAITLKQAKALYDKSIQFIDARDGPDFLAGHIINSVNIPFDDFESYKQKLDKLSKEKPYVIYCAGTECDLSILLGNKLFELGYKQIYIFFGGWVDWQNANYPIEHNSE